MSRTYTLRILGSTAWVEGVSLAEARGEAMRAPIDGSAMAIVCDLCGDAVALDDNQCDCTREVRS